MGQSMETPGAALCRRVLANRAVPSVTQQTVDRRSRVCKQGLGAGEFKDAVFPFIRSFYLDEEAVV